MHGLQLKWNEDGKIVEWGYYQDGRRHGATGVWVEAKNEYVKNEYKNGYMITKTTWFETVGLAFLAIFFMIGELFQILPQSWQLAVQRVFQELFRVLKYYLKPKVKPPKVD
jgi:hypothetical protein